MTRRAAAAGIRAGLAAAALAGWIGACQRPAAGPGGEQGPETTGAVDTSAVELYYPSTAGWLGAESRELPAASSARERAEQVAAALLAGPAEPAHLPPLADGVILAGVYLSADGVIYLDLASDELSAPPVSGSRGELLTVYSFVNSILANVPEARAVALLWNGSQRPTFAGHVDTTRPLPAEPSWLGSR